MLSSNLTCDNLMFGDSQKDNLKILCLCCQKLVAKLFNPVMTLNLA